MNSLEKQNIPPTVETPETYVVSFEKELLAANDLLEIEILMKKLQFLGINFDPFQNEPSTECNEIMNQLGLTTHLQNPYLATNILLRLLDKTEERLNNLKQ